jgi:hypothetical protein
MTPSAMVLAVMAAYTLAVAGTFTTSSPGSSVPKRFRNGTTPS